MTSPNLPFFDRWLRSLKHTPTWLLVWAAACVLLLLQRFSHWGGVPFVNDEAAFLSSARNEVSTNTWVSASPIAGTQGMRYGPSVLWFYAIVQRVFGSDARASIAVMCLLVTLAHALALLGVARAFKLRALDVLGLSAFVASSSYQLFWSRLAWDQLVNVCGSLLLLVLSSLTLSAWHAVGMGLLIGVGLSSHLFSVPLVVCTFLVLAFEHRHQLRRGAMIGGITVALVLLVNLPYLSFLVHDGSRPTPQTGSLSLAESLSWFSMPAQVASFSGFEYFFDGAWGQLLAYVGADYEWMRFTQAPNALAGLALIGLGFGVPMRESQAATRLARLSLVTWTVYTLFYAYRGLLHHPHYIFPYWWVVMVGLASLLAELRRVSVPLARVLLAVISLVAVAQLSFSNAWLNYVDAEGGTRGVHYGTPVAHQYRALKTACARPEPVIRIENHTVILPHALTYVAQTERRCRTKQVEICAGYCAPPAPGTASLRLVYPRPTGGDVAIGP
jgi:hypothetical protein